MKKFLLSLLFVFALFCDSVYATDSSSIYRMLENALTGQDEFISIIDEAIDEDDLQSYSEGVEIKVGHSVSLFGEYDTVGSSAVVYDDTLHIPIRAFSEKLDYEVGWNEDTNEAYIESNDKTVVIPTVSGEASGEEIQGVIINGTTYAPVSEIADATGYTVNEGINGGNVKLLKKFQTKRLFVKLTDSSKLTDESLVEAFEGITDIVLNPYGLVFAEFDTESSAAKAYELLKNNGLVQYVEPDNLFPAEFLANNYTWGTQYCNFDNFIQANSDFINTDNEVTVAIIDTVLNAQDPVFNNRVVYDTSMNLNSAPDGHGTHVAGIVASVTSSAGDKIKICPYRLEVTYDSSGQTMLNTANMYTIVSRASEHEVINMSIGMTALSERPLIKEAILAAANTLFVVAAGNDSAEVADDTLAKLISTMPNGIVVTAVDSSGNPAFFSSFSTANNKSYIAAPGVDVWSTYYVDGSSYVSMDGTSMASPHVAGACAILCLINDNASKSQIKQTLLSNHCVIPQNWNSKYGVGILSFNYSIGGKFGDGFSWSYSDGSLKITGDGELPQFSANDDIPWKAYADKISRISFDGNIDGITADKLGKLTKLNKIIVSDDNTHYTIVNGTLYTKSKDTLVLCPSDAFGGEYVISDGTVTVGSNAFFSCTRLSSVVIPSSVKSIAVDSFKECSYLLDIYYTGTLAQWDDIQKP